MLPDFKLLGWNEIEVKLGSLSQEKETWEKVVFDWQPGDIRNCSYARAKSWIGLTGEDRTNGGQVLAVHDLINRTEIYLQRITSILRNAVNQAGSLVCYTTPKGEPGVADLQLIDLESQQPQRIDCAVAHDSTPSWFADNKRLAFHTPERKIQIVSLENSMKEDITTGTHPAVSNDGKRLAFLRDGLIWLWQMAVARADPLEINKGWLETEVLGTLSWSPDDQWISFGVSSGVTGKEPNFYLYDVANKQQHKLDVKYLKGLIIVQ